MLKNKFVPIIVFLSFIIGFIFGEDTLGSAKHDYLYHVKYFYNFSENFFNTFKNFGMDQVNENVRNSPIFFNFPTIIVNVFNRFLCKQ